MIVVLAQSVAREILTAVAIAVLTAAGVKAIDEVADEINRRRFANEPVPPEVEQATKETT